SLQNLNYQQREYGKLGTTGATLQVQQTFCHCYNLN
ncbi:MAG: hypothetical protein ACI8S7_001575, partial [Candidatus Krumholzibacteriia bacterium]